MPSQRHGRVHYLAALCLIALFLFVLRLNEITASTSHFQTSSKSTLSCVYNSTLGFGTILAINAPWRTDRKDSLTLAATITGLTLEWIDGVNASDISEEAFPQDNWRSLSEGNLGSWRAHMDAVSTVVQRNLSTALIVEDDVDWNFALKQQLQKFALASRTLPMMIEESDLKARQNTRTPDHILNSTEASQRSTSLLRATPNSNPSSPYGLDWDVLWLGHCGTSLPPYPFSTSTPHLEDRLILPDDASVPATNPLTSTHLSSLYPPHTRIYHRSSSALCTLAYAVTQHGARRILYEHGIRHLDAGYDFALSAWCDGETRVQKEGMRERPMCLTSSLTVFGHFWPGQWEGGGGKSDISGVGVGGVDRGRWTTEGVRGSLWRLVEGGMM